MAERVSADPTLRTYGQSAMVEFYAAQRNLQPAEAALFRRYVGKGAAVLDLGVGGGRTTAALTEVAGSYVGVDYSKAMVEHCRRAFPGQRFEVGDARQLVAFPDGSFDVVVFSFNGIDSIPDRTGRQACLREVARLLRPGGTFLFSVHNARYLVFRPVLADVSPLRWVWRLAYACLHSAWLMTRLATPAFWSGFGRLRDLGTHGGLPIFVSTPEKQGEEIRAAGLEVVEVLRAPDPALRPAFAVPWHYYACRKP